MSALFQKDQPASTAPNIAQPVACATVFLMRLHPPAGIQCGSLLMGEVYLAGVNLRSRDLRS